MNIESMLLSKNRDSFNRIITMMRSLIVKDNYEATAAETVETAEAYDNYERALEGNDTVLDYAIYKNELVAAGITPTKADEYIVDPRSLQSALMGGDPAAKKFITAKRKQRVNSYVENNIYYRPFCGLPATTDQYIRVTNTDKKDPDDPDIIFLHQVNFKDYPKTYNRLYYERDIDLIYNDFDYQYLQFIEHPMTPYEIRNKNQFDICYHDKNALNGNELNYFFEAYNAARNEIMSIDYIDAFEQTYSAYTNTMFMFILYYTFNLYCANSLERYAVRDYTDDEIYDILDSNGLSTLKTLDMDLLKRVVKFLPDIKANLGTQKIIDIIFDIVTDKTLTIKQYYLDKKYNIDDKGDTSLDSEGLYNNSVDLVFKEKTIKQGENATFVSDGEFPYEDIVMQDDTWGGTHNMDPKEKLRIKTEMKKQLLSADFASIMTKYIGISKIVDMYIKTIDASDKLGLIYQANEDKGNFIKDDTVIFNGIEVTSLSIYAAWCLMYGTLNGLTDPDYIIKDESTIEGVMKLRKNSDIPKDIEETSEIVIDLGNGYNRTLGDYLTEEEIKDNLVGFNYTSVTPIEDIISQYGENFNIIAKIKEKLNKQSDYAEYEVWRNIQKANRVSVNIQKLFSGFDTYSEYIRVNDPDFYKYIESYSTGGVSRETLVDIIKQLKDSYAGYIKEISNGSVIMITEEADASGDQSLSDISILFNQFMSCYTQLFSQDFHVGYDDPGENSLVLLYSKFLEKFITSDFDALELVQNLLKDTTYAKDDAAYLVLEHYMIDTSKTENFEELILIMEFISSISKESVRDFIEFTYSMIKQRVSNKNSTNLVLDDVIKIKEI